MLRVVFGGYLIALHPTIVSDVLKQCFGVLFEVEEAALTNYEALLGEQLMLAYRKRSEGS